MYKIGSYEIYGNEFVGKGSFSTVYKGKYVGPNRPKIKYGKIIAVKIINSNKMNIRASKIIDDEIDIMNMIKENPHPNIVECYDVIKTNTNIYIFMEYCDSGDLRNILRKPIKEKYTQFYFSQLANGLKYLDQNNIIHRDIKPRNILLTNKRRVLKIADFGFAKQSKEISLYDTICGSPMYMAPEILDRGNEKYDGRTDLWSIGMILYEMLYAVHPYQACKSIPELQQQNKSDTQILIPPDNNTNGDVSDECLSLLRNLLQKSANNRITWPEFFDHPWLNLYQYIIPKTNKKNEEYENQISACSIGSLANRDSVITEAQDINVEIIDNYCNNYNITSITSEYLHNINKDDNDKQISTSTDEDTMFDMDNDEHKTQTHTKTKPIKIPIQSPKKTLDDSY